MTGRDPEKRKLQNRVNAQKSRSRAKNIQQNYEKLMDWFKGPFRSCLEGNVGLQHAMASAIGPLKQLQVCDIESIFPSLGIHSIESLNSSKFDAMRGSNGVCRGGQVFAAFPLQPASSVPMHSSSMHGIMSSSVSSTSSAGFGTSSASIGQGTPFAFSSANATTSTTSLHGLHSSSASSASSNAHISNAFLSSLGSPISQASLHSSLCNANSGANLMPQSAIGSSSAYPTGKPILSSLLLHEHRNGLVGTSSNTFQMSQLKGLSGFSSSDFSSISTQSQTKPQCLNDEGMKSLQTPISCD